MDYNDGKNKIFLATPTGRKTGNLVRVNVGGTVIDPTVNPISIDFSQITTGAEYTTNTTYTIIDAAGDYLDNVDKSIRINVPGVTGFTISSTSMNIEDGYDFLYIYNTSNTADGAHIASATGTTALSNVTASNDITIRFKSDHGTTGPGFSITVTPL